MAMTGAFSKIPPATPSSTAYARCRRNVRPAFPDIAGPPKNLLAPTHEKGMLVVSRIAGDFCVCAVNQTLAVCRSVQRPARGWGVKQRCPRRSQSGARVPLRMSSESRILRGSNQCAPGRTDCSTAARCAASTMDVGRLPGPTVAPRRAAEDNPCAGRSCIPSSSTVLLRRADPILLVRMVNEVGRLERDRQPHSPS